MRRQIGRLLAACAVAWLPPAMAAAPWVLFDDFSAPIDPAKWPDVGMERARYISGGGLVLMQKDWGNTGTDSGRIVQSLSDTITNSTPVRQFRTNLRVLALENTGCAANPSPTRSRARIFMTFFNTGGRTAGSFTGDVYAQINVYRDSNSTDPAGVMQVTGSAGVCVASDCNTSTSIGSTLSLGTLNVGQNTLIQIDWDRATKTLYFTRDQGAAAGSLIYGSLSDAAEPGNTMKFVGTRNEVANCSSGPRPYGMIQARFDNTSVNKGAKP